MGSRHHPHTCERRHSRTYTRACERQAERMAKKVLAKGGGGGARAPCAPPGSASGDSIKCFTEIEVYYIRRFLLLNVLEYVR